MKKVSVIGLGYVGLPLACLAVEKGFDVTGIDLKEDRLQRIRDNEIDTEEPIVKKILAQGLLKTANNYDSLKQADVITICVPTWVDESHEPRFDAIENACKTIAQYLTKGTLIVVESTIGPLTGDELIIPTLEKSGLKSGKDFFIAHCPERINPGDTNWNLETIPRVLGANSEKEATIAREFYTTLLKSDVQIVGNLKEVASVKIVENTFRDVNIALANEFAQAFDKLGIDVTKVINGAATKPFAFLAHFPSFGVGGYCIPVVPYYLVSPTKKAGGLTGLIEKAREINSTMPSYAVNKLKDSLQNMGMKLKDAKVAILGLSYKKNLGETRYSTAIDVAEMLKAEGADVRAYDPYLPENSNVETIDKAIGDADAIFLATDHDEFKELNNGLLSKTKARVIMDGKNYLDKDYIIGHGVKYLGIGR